MILRRASTADAEICARIQREANRVSLPFLPTPPDLDDVVAFFETKLLVENVDVGNFSGNHAAQAQHPIVHQLVLAKAPVLGTICLVRKRGWQTIGGWIPNSACIERAGK